MIVVLLYLIASIAMSTMLERNRKSVAVVGHALLFAFALFVLLFATDIPVFKNFMLRFFDEEHYNNLLARIALQDVPVLVPFAIAELFALVQLFVTALYFGCKVVARIVGKLKRNFVLLRSENVPLTTAELMLGTKIYSILQVFRC